MRIALISDVHGNLEALRAVLAAAEAVRPEALWCLGDLVGYGPEPEACTALIRERCDLVIRGNHDAAAAGTTSTALFNEFARRAVEWTRDALSGDALRYLEGLPLTARAGEALLAHGSPQEPEAWHYLFGPADAAAAFRAFEERICFVGHTHVPFVLSLDEGGEMVPEYHSAVDLSPERRYLVNVGSVGQPRDRDPRAAFALYDAEAGRVEIAKVAYDIEATQRRMEECSLPRYLSERLAQGR